MIQEGLGTPHDFNVEATFGEDYQLHPIREGNYSLMDLFLRHYSGAELAPLNVFHQHKHVIHVSCIVFCDDQTINTDCLSMMRGHLDHHKFPLQYPTRSDHSLWKEALQLIRTPFYTFPLQLGSYMDIPHK